MAQKHLKPVIQNLILRYKEILEREFPITQVIVFGSQAKGTASQYSDIDVCVISPLFGEDYHQALVSLLSASIDINGDFDIVPYTPSDIANQYDPLAKEIRTHGIRVA